MSLRIQDGTGKGYLAKVTAKNKVETKSIIINEVADVSAVEGQAYLVVSDFLSLTTTGSFNGIIYLKNNSATKNLHIETIRVCSTHTGTVQSKLIKNPTAGTLISDAHVADQVNANLASSNVFDGLAYAASADGKTVTDGTFMSNFINRSPGHSVQEYGGMVILGPGNSLAIACKPDGATTLCVECQVYFETK